MLHYGKCRIQPFWSSGMINQYVSVSASPYLIDFNFMVVQYQVDCLNSTVTLCVYFYFLIGLLDYH